MNKQSLLYLWKERTMFIGRIDSPIQLSQGAATLCVSLEQEITVTLPKKNVHFQCTSVLIPPSYTVQIDTNKQLVANLNLDVMGADYFRLSQKMAKTDGKLRFNFEEEFCFKKLLLDIYKNAYGSAEARDKLFSNLNKTELTDFTIEKRVQKIVDLIQSAIDDNLSIDYLAEQVNLSVPALFKIFKKQTGIPIRRYRQWHRLFITANEIGKGKNMTEAALTAGFVDLSHCAHTFNLMLGMRPSYFLQRPQDIAVITEAPYPLSGPCHANEKRVAQRG